MPACKHCRAQYVVTLPEKCQVCKAPLVAPDTPGPDIRDVNQRVDFIRRMAESLVADAERMGVVLTIENRPLPPLAMGNHMMVVEARVQRELATPIDRIVESAARGDSVITGSWE